MGASYEVMTNDDILLYTHSSAVTKDTPIHVAGLGVLIPAQSADANVQIAYKKVGTFKFTVANSVAIAIGDNVYFDSTNEVIQKTKPAAGFLLGSARTAGTGTSAGTVLVEVAINSATTSDGAGDYGSTYVYAGAFVPKKTPTTLDDADATLTADQLLLGLLKMTPTAARTLTLPAASALLVKFPNSVVGSTIRLTVKDLAAATYGITIAASSSITNGGVAGDLSIAASGTATYEIIFTNVTTGSVAATIVKV
jgi:hypothetical protein